MVKHQFILYGGILAWLCTGCGVSRPAALTTPSPSAQTSRTLIASTSSTSESSSHATPSASAESSAPASSTLSSSVNSTPVPTVQTVTLPVSIITPTFGGSATAFSYPTHITVTVPVAWAPQIQAVGAVGFVAIVPKGWTGQAAEGADGSRSVTLYPQGGLAHHGPRLTIETAGACEGCAWAEAYPYFSWVQQHYQSSWGFVDNAAPIPGYVAGPNLRFYTAPTTPNGYHVTGIAYAPFITQPKSFILFRRAQVVLPPGEHSLASVMLNELLSQIEGSAGE